MSERKDTALGQVIRSVRESRKLNIAQMAPEFGLRKSELLKIESGERPTRWELARIAKALGLIEARADPKVALEEMIQGISLDALEDMIIATLQGMAIVPLEDETITALEERPIAARHDAADNIMSKVGNKEIYCRQGKQFTVDNCPEIASCPWGLSCWPMRRD